MKVISLENTLSDNNSTKDLKLSHQKYCIFHKNTNSKPSIMYQCVFIFMHYFSQICFSQTCNLGITLSSTAHSH